MSSYYAEVYAIVSLIPSGKVASYGQVAKLTSRPRAARQVGYAMAALKEDSEIPWHRVVNARGEISSRMIDEYEDFQRYLLEEEGVEFGLKGRIDLHIYRWEPA